MLFGIVRPCVVVSSLFMCKPYVGDVVHYKTLRGNYVMLWALCGQVLIM